MTIITDTYIPYEFDKLNCLKYLESRTCGLRNSLRVVEKDTEHITIRCPMSGDYLDVIGTAEELEWLDDQLQRRNLYKLT